MRCFKDKVHQLAVLLTCGLFGLFFGGAVLAQEASDVTVRVMGVNDFHGFLERGEQALYLPEQGSEKTVAVEAGGAANLAHTIEELRQSHALNMLVSSGDMVGASPLESSLFHDEPTIELFNQLGLDVAAFGNHEFDHGRQHLQRLMGGGCTESTDERISCFAHPFKGSQFHWVGSNVHFNGKRFGDGYVVVERDGIRIGVIGVELPGTVQMVSPAGIVGMTFEDELSTVEKKASELDRLGVHAKVLSIHDGGSMKWRPAERTSCDAMSQPFQKFARDASKFVDVIFSAHTHQGYACDVNGVPVVQAFSYGRAIAVVDLSFSKADHHLKKAKTNYFLQPVWAQAIPASVETQFMAIKKFESVQELAFLKPYVEKARNLTRQIAGRLSAPLPNRQLPGDLESAGARLIADAQLAFAQTKDPAVDLALMNLGGVRTSLGCSPAPCEVTYGQLSSMQPFRNGLVVLDMTGQQILDLLQAQSKNFPYSVLTPSHTLTYEWQVNASQGKVKNVRIRNAPMILARHYKVVVNSFLADGGDGHSMLAAATRLDELGEDIKALAQWFKAHSETQVPTQPRVRLVQ